MAEFRWTVKHEHEKEQLAERYDTRIKHFI